MGHNRKQYNIPFKHARGNAEDKEHAKGPGGSQTPKGPWVKEVMIQRSLLGSLAKAG